MEEKEQSFDEFYAELRSHLYRKLGFGGPQEYPHGITTGGWREKNETSEEAPAEKIPVAEETEQDPVPAEFPVLRKREQEQGREEEVEECGEGCEEECGEEGDEDGNGDEDGGFHSSWV